jgi:hypothetical protein
MLICVCLRILASSRIPQYDLGRQTPHFLRWFCHSAPSGGALTEGMMGWRAVGGSPRAQRRAAWLHHGGGAACSQRVRRSTDSDPASERDSGGGASPGSWSSRHARSSPCLRPPRSPAAWKWRRHGVGVGRCLQKLHPPAMNQA